MKISSTNQLLSPFFVLVLLFATVHAFYDKSVETQKLTKSLTVDYKATGTGNSDDSAKVQQAIDDIAKAGGGSLVIPSGKYQFGDIKMRSNVHIKVAKGVEISALSKTSKTSFEIFQFGREVGPIENVSIRGIDGKFTFKVPSQFTIGRVISMGKVKNFYLANFHTEDSLTTFSSVIMSPEGKSKQDIDYPRQGTMENVSISNLRAGYGLIQAHAAERVLFRDLDANGNGVTLRLETGLNRMNDNQIGGVHNIMAENISGTNCKTPVLFQPHSMHNGVVKVTNVKANKCTYGVLVSKGFVSSKANNKTIIPGTWGKGSYVKNIEASYGTEAPLHDRDLRNLPTELQKLAVKLNGENLPRYHGPSVAAVGIRETQPLNIKFFNIKPSGFTVQKESILQLN